MNNERGYSLIELSIVLAVLGLVAIAAAKLLVHAPAKLSPQSGSLPETMFTVDAALKGFLFAQSRLPCPALNNLGVESCGGANAVGEVPWRTLGLASMPKNSMGLSLRYGVYRAANATLSLDADLAQAIDRFNPLLPRALALPPIMERVAASPTHINGMDVCTGLRNAMVSPLATALRVNAPTGLLQRAYVLVDPGPTDADPGAATVSLFDGLNATAATNNLFEMPESALSATYNDQVLSVGFSELWGEMQCSATMAALHAHANVASSAVILQQALSDYRAQLDVMVPFSMVGVTAATQAHIATASGVAAPALAVNITAALDLIAPPSALPNGTTPALTTAAGTTIFSNQVAGGGNGNVVVPGAGPPVCSANGVQTEFTVTTSGYITRVRKILPWGTFGGWRYNIAGGPYWVTWYSTNSFFNLNGLNFWWTPVVAGEVVPRAINYNCTTSSTIALNISAANIALTANYVTEFDTVFGVLGTWNTLTSTVRSNADNADRAGLFGQ